MHEMSCEFKKVVEVNMKKIIIVTLLLNLCGHAGDITLTGTVVSDGQKMIGSRFMGYIKHVFVKVGDKVKREDDLYEMESAEFDMMKMQTDLMLEQSKVAVEYWREKLRGLNIRRSKLKHRVDEGNTEIHLDDFADLDSQAANVESMLVAMQLMVKEANIAAKKMVSTYNYIKMKAPSDGVVVQRNIKVGDMVMPGMLTIMLVDTEDLEIDVSISESIISKVKEGQKVPIEIPSLKYRTIGLIHAIVPDANPMTHKIKMRITFDKGDKNVIPGMYAKVTIHEAE